MELLISVVLLVTVLRRRMKSNSTHMESIMEVNTASKCSKRLHRCVPSIVNQAPLIRLKMMRNSTFHSVALLDHSMLRV